MEQKSQDIILGTCCSICGAYFEDAQTEELYSHGQPVVCEECWNALPDSQRAFHEKAKIEIIN